LPRRQALAPKPKPQDGAIVYTARKTDCGACPIKPQCTRAEKRTVLRLINEPALERVARRLKAEPTLVNKRAQSVEPAFGTLKRWLNSGRFLLRGRPKAKTELGLVSLACNLKRLANLHGTARLQQALA
jgi:adenine-specific DNA glycosylase